MGPELVKGELVDVLRKIQRDGGQEDADTIGGGTVPLDDLQEFDSKLAPIAIKRLARALGITIPKDKNIFREGGRSRGRKLSINEIAAIVAHQWGRNHLGETQKP